MDPSVEYSSHDQETQDGQSGRVFGPLVTRLLDKTAYSNRPCLTSRSVRRSVYCNAHGDGGTGGGIGGRRREGREGEEEGFLVNSICIPFAFSLSEDGIPKRIKSKAMANLNTTNPQLVGENGAIMVRTVVWVGQEAIAD